MIIHNTPQPRFNRQSLSFKLILQIGSAVFVALAIVTVAAVLMATSVARDLAYQKTMEQARDHANAFNAQMQAGQSVAHTIADTMEAYGTKSRDEVSKILKHLLEDNPAIVGSYVGYEPNAFDGKDAQYVDAQGHDATGRLVPYWNRLTGVVALEPLVDYETSDYYQLPKKTGQDSVIEPYLYEGVLMASFISPSSKARLSSASAASTLRSTTWTGRSARSKYSTPAMPSW